MQIIRRYVDRISEELRDAQHYGEKYVEWKARGNSGNANRYREMANDELKHAMFLHDMALAEIEELRRVYQPPVSMQEAWEKCHAEYVEKTATLRQILSM